MKLKLKCLTIENFKGIANFKFEPSEKTTLITGKNGTGKTSVADAFYWLFDDADSEQKNNFNIIEIDQSGNAVNHQDAIVSAEIIADGETIILSKKYYQKWVKKRGQAEKEFSGRTTDHFWNEALISKKEYTERLGDIIKPKLFRSLSDTNHFCGRAKIDFKRDLLIELIGNISDETIIDQFDELSPLKDVMTNLDDHRKIMLAKRRKLNKQLDDIPKLVAEHKKMMPETKEFDEEELRIDLKVIEEKIDKKKNEILSLSSGIKIVEEEKEYSKLEIELNKIMLNRNNETIQNLNKKIKAVDEEIASNKLILDNLGRSLQALGYDIKENISKRKKLEADYKVKKLEKINVDTVCFACGQSIPESKILEQKKKFKDKKKMELEQINGVGLNLFKQYQALKSKEIEISNDSTETETSITQLIDKKNKIVEGNTEIALIEKKYDEKISVLKEKMESIKNNIDSLKVDIMPEKQRLESELSKFKNEESKIKGNLALFSEKLKGENRIKELEENLSVNASEYEEVEKQLFLIEMFIRKKAEYIEENVSNKFQLTKWKLFDIQINEGIRDICEATYEGVSYNTDLNTGSRVNIGLDVISTLSNHFNTFLPIFVDNAESVTNWLIDMDNQIIRLVAVANVEKLEIINEDHSSKIDKIINKGVEIINNKNIGA